MNVDLKNLFSSPLWTFDLTTDDPQLNTMVIMDGQNYSQYVDQQHRLSNSPAFDPNNYNFFEYQGYGIERLREYTNQAIKQISQDRNWPETTVHIKARHNVIHPGECDTPHHHPGLDLVGVYYAEVPANSGDLLINETRGSMNLIWQEPLITADDQRRTGRVYYRVKPKVGTLVMFPNYLFHSVETNLSNDIRISIVMDIRINRIDDRGIY